MDIDVYLDKIIRLTNKFIFQISGTDMMIIQLGEERFDVTIAYATSLNYEDSLAQEQGNTEVLNKISIKE